MSTDPSSSQPEYQGEPWRPHDPNAAQPGQQPPQQPWSGAPGPWQWPEAQNGVPPVPGAQDPNSTQQVWPNTGDLAGPGVLPSPQSPTQPGPGLPFPGQPQTYHGQPQTYQGQIYQPPAEQPAQPQYPPQPQYPQQQPAEPQYPQQQYPPQQYPPQQAQPQQYPPVPYQQAGSPASAPPYPGQPQHWAAQPPVSSPPISIPPISGIPVSGSTSQPVYPGQAQPVYPGQPQAQPVYPGQPQAQPVYPPAQPDYGQAQPAILPRPGWAEEQPAPNNGGDWQGDDEQTPGKGRLWLGLLVGLLVGAAIAAPAAYFLKPSAKTEAAPPVATPSAAPSSTLSTYEQARLAINKPKFTGDLTKLSEPWLPYLGDCASNSEGGQAPGKGQTKRVGCRYGGVSVVFATYQSGSTRDDDRAIHVTANNNIDSVAPGGGTPGRKEGGVSKAQGNYIEYAYKNLNNEIVCGIWWDRDDDTAALTLEGPCGREFGGKWEPLRDLWKTHS